MMSRERLNLGLTRAMNGCIFIGDSQLLSTQPKLAQGDREVKLRENDDDDVKIV